MLGCAASFESRKEAGAAPGQLDELRVVSG
jgi:hypothetical protein